jgi:phytoene synthase
MPHKIDTTLLINNHSNDSVSHQILQNHMAIIDAPYVYTPRKNEWSEHQWNEFNASLRDKALNAKTEEQAWEELVKGARKVMRNYTTSFFILTRFLPVKKRQKVEAIYAAVRYPDEIVDTFNISNQEKITQLNIWSQYYEEALQGKKIKELLQQNIPPLLVGFIRVVQECKIPHHYYRAFLDAMRLDVEPVVYTNMDNLIDSYIYGSAIVVGYFLAYIYGSRTPQDFPQTLDASKDLGIALQLTNFMRDIADDKKRKRIYIPLEFLKQAEIQIEEVFAESSKAKLKVVVNHILDIAEDYYSKAQSRIDAFSKDSQTAIQACIDVYRQLNDQIRFNKDAIINRQSVPFMRKFRVLPMSKYWRLPRAYLFGA